MLIKTTRDITASKNGYYQKREKIINADRDVEKRDPLHIVGGNVN
jgi:hypothetical protein